MDRRKGWRAAEKLLKQGKVQAALQQLRKVAEGGVDDSVTLNRLADLLAQQKKVSEAISIYVKIARRFEDGGFAPKAIAIHKKVLRLDPDHVDSAIGLGRLYHRQKLQGEARKYLLHAANRCLKAKDYARAGAVFEQLVEAEPSQLQHRVRLAETRVAQGDAERAASDLVTVGQSLLDRGEVQEAARIFERSQELAPASDPALIGAARCFEAVGRGDRALELLETRVGTATPASNVLGELARLYDAAGRRDDAFKLLEEASPLDVPHDMWKRMVSAAIERGDDDALWERIDGVLERAGTTNATAVVELLTDLSELEDGGHIPALQRLTRWYEARGEVRRTVGTLEALARAYATRSMDEEASSALAQMRAIAPPDEEPRASSDGIRFYGTHRGAPPEPEERFRATELSPASEAVSLDAEAPAVPLSQAEEEFVTGRITQAEVLEKYDLTAQALEQLEEVVRRFPGHVPALERRVELTRTLARDEDLAVALTQLAVAQRAAGESSAAVRAAHEAGEMTSLPTGSRRVLEQLGLIRVATAPAPPVPDPPASSPPGDPGTAQATASTGDEVVIDLDADDGPPDAERAVGEPKAGRSPSPELLAEIRNEAAEGKVADARRKLDALVLLGYAGPEVEQIHQEIELAAALESPRSSPSAAAEPADEVPPTPAAAPGFPTGDDLEAIRAALEQEFGEDSPEPVVPEPDEENVDEIVGAFRQQIEEEIDAGDHRTHYDLGIGYKEMGLVDEAIHEFERAAGAPELRREACAMLAMCHKDRGDMPEAARWFRAALEAEPDDTPTSRDLRYDLAEVLLEGGDTASALETFRDLQSLDPTFRDVKGRIAELEGRLQS